MKMGKIVFCELYLLFAGECLTETAAFFSRGCTVLSDCSDFRNQVPGGDISNLLEQCQRNMLPVKFGHCLAVPDPIIPHIVALP